MLRQPQLQYIYKALRESLHENVVFSVCDSMDKVYLSCGIPFPVWTPDNTSLTPDVPCCQGEKSSKEMFT